MTVLKPTSLKGELTAILVNPSHNNSLQTDQVAQATLTFQGLEGDSHSSLVRSSCVRTKKQYTVGTPIRNVRQLTIIGSDELMRIGDEIAILANSPLPGPILAEWLGANMVIDGLPDLTLLPPSSRLIFENGASVVIDMENEPCSGPAKLIEAHYPGFGKFFVKAAMMRRGVTAWVEREGSIELGDMCDLHCPPLRKYPHL